MSIIGFACSGVSLQPLLGNPDEAVPAAAGDLSAQRELLGECRNALLLQLPYPRLRRLYDAATYFILFLAELLSIWYNT